MRFEQAAAGLVGADGGLEAFAGVVHVHPVVSLEACPMSAWSLLSSPPLRMNRLP